MCVANRNGQSLIDTTYINRRQRRDRGIDQTAILKQVVEALKIELKDKDKDNNPRTLCPLTIKRGKLKFLIGLPRSGKSTYATHWMRTPSRVDEHGIAYPRVVVAGDDIRLAVTGIRYNRRAEPTVFLVKDYMTETLLSRGHDVLLDETNTSVESIKRILRFDINANYRLIDTPLSVCLQRAVDTGQDDLEEPIKKMWYNLQQLLSYGIDRTINKLKKEIMEERGK